MKPISRRALLKNGAFSAGSLALTSAWSPKVFAQSLAKQTGLQLYTVGPELSNDLEGTLAKIAAIGYRSVESAGLAGKTAGQFRKALDAAGLKCPSSHLFPTAGQSTEQFLEAAKTLGSEYAVSSLVIKLSPSIRSAADYIKQMDSLTEDDYKRMVGDLNSLATQAKAAGLKFAYHNHNMEFRRWGDGLTAYDILMTGTDPALVKIELDCGWADLGGASPLALFQKYSGRFRMLHIKDFQAVGHPVTSIAEDSRPVWTELGKGHIDYRAILSQAPKAGVEHIFVEQEPPFTQFTALEAAKADYDYLQSIA